MQALQDVRRLAVELRPAALVDFGAGRRSRAVGQTFGERTGVQTGLEVNLAEGRLPAETETALYRFIQEALTNVIKHAGAERVSIVLTQRDGGVRVVVEDDGRGFEDRRRSAGRPGFTGMRERIALVGGALEIESSPGAGTTIVAYVPLTTGASTAVPSKSPAIS